MNLKFLLIIIAGLGVTSFGVLSNDLALDVQKFDLVVLPPKDGIPIDGAAVFSSIQCTCVNPNDPDDFDPSFCDTNSIGPVATDLCTWPFPPP